MKPYLAVIADSFHSALSSRILWVAFVAVWGFLALLAPIGYKEDYTAKFSFLELRNGTQMKAMLARGLIDPKEEASALGRLVRSFPKDLQDDLRQIGRNEVRIGKDLLADALNDAIEDESWYDAAAWKSTVRLRELRDLDDTPETELTNSQRQRRARLRIEAALPGIFPARTSRSVVLSYAGFPMPAEAAFAKEQFISIANQVILPLIMNWLLGLALIFLGILVTASMIPDMLQPGSLHLLLSKPISRPMLLLCKFVGGCAFVLLCVSQLVVGLYLIAGLRLDIWNTKILWCIPVSVFLFAVYFSVSMLAGLRWRSPILSIGVTCIFAAIVILVGFIGRIFDRSVRQPDKLQRVVLADDSIIATTYGGSVQTWDEASKEWQLLVDGKDRGGDLILPPERLDRDHIVTARIAGGRFNSYGSGSLRALILSRQDDWRPESGLSLPIGTSRLIATDGDHVLALNNSSLMVTSQSKLLDSAALSVVTGDANKANDASGAAGEDAGQIEINSASTGPNLANLITSLMRMEGGPTKHFRPVLPKRFALSAPVRVSVSDDKKHFNLCTRGRLARLKLPAQDDSVCELIVERTLEGDDSKPTILAASGDWLLIARDDEAPQILNSITLESIQEIELSETDAMPAAVVGDGGTRVIYHAAERRQLPTGFENRRSLDGQRAGVFRRDVGFLRPRRRSCVNRPPH